jgi:glycosyltransferase involved in cell wall biosynthesis
LSAPDRRRPRPVIVHVIDSLVRGGAETLLVNLLPALAERYDIVLVTLRPERDFAPEDVVCREYHCLGYTGAASLASCAWKLRRIIRRHRPDLVRAQLYLSSVVARLATPRGIPLVFSIHNPMSEDSYRKNRLALPLEKLTYRKRHALISVSEDALRDFDRWVGVKGRAYILYNFINPAYLEAARVRDGVGRCVRMVAVGMLKKQKNYFYLIEAFRQLEGRDISLDIYGEGPLRAKLQAEIDRHGLPITLKGKRGDIYEVLPDYDLYVMSSSYEGFGIAPVEAMAAGLPALLSDLPVLREVSGGNALFFDPADPAALVDILDRILAGEVDLKALSAGGIERATSCFQKDAYVEKLGAIYSELMSA